MELYQLKAKDVLGCVAEMRGGDKGFILPIRNSLWSITQVAIVGKDWYTSLDVKDGYLQSTNFCDQYDIVKIYMLGADMELYNRHDTDSIVDWLSIPPTEDNLLWEEERHPMTLADIEHRLGYKIKLIDN